MSLNRKLVSMLTTVVLLTYCNTSWDYNYGVGGDFSSKIPSSRPKVSNSHELLGQIQIVGLLMGQMTHVWIQSMGPWLPEPL